MEVKPVPKPRSIVSSRPVPAPRNLQAPPLPPPRSVSPSDSSHSSDKSDEVAKPASETRSANSEFFRSLSNSSKNLKDEISERMTVKGRAVISSTRNASIRLEKSVKNLLTRRLTSLNNEDIQAANEKKIKDPIQDDRCVSMPADNIFSTISFYSPIHGNLKSVKNVENLSNVTEEEHLPPPIYPPPPPPDESIYDELQSVTSGHSSSRYDTLSSTISERVDRDFSDSFNLLSFVQNHRGSDSDQSLNLSDINMNDGRSDGPRRVSRSDSWTFYDTASSKMDSDVMSNVDENDGVKRETLHEDRTSIASTIGRLSVQNSLYENWQPQKPNSPISPSAETIPSPGERSCSRSVLFEFDPFAKIAEENVYSNYENNDLMLLEALLATSESPSNEGSTADLREEAEVPEEEEVVGVTAEEDEEEEEEDVEVDSTGTACVPPDPPRRYDSLPKNEYDEVELVEQADKITGKNPALLPKLAQLAKRKQPAVPPRRPSIKIHVDVPSNSRSRSTDTSSGSANSEGSSTSAGESSKVTEERRSSVMQKLKKLRHDSTAHVKPNVMSFMRGSRLLSRNREHAADANSKNTLKLERPKFAGHNVSTHRGVVYRPGVGMERAKDLVQRMAVLTDNKVSFYTDKSLGTLKEVIQLELVHSVHVLHNVKVVDNEAVHCIAVSGEDRPGVHVFYAKGITERRIWAQRIFEALTPVFPIKYTAELIRAGWAYLKEGVTGTWFPAWLVLQQRTLVYTRSLDPTVFEHLDLRKARCIVLREQEGPMAGGECVPVVVVDAGGSGALHITAPGKREGPAWRHALHQIATSCGPALDQQQLTQDNVPVILDKCINFIYAHGIMSEGIYRRSGSSSAVVRLLETFRRDAWATQITKGAYSEHDVATVVRRFLRDLPHPLLPADIHDQLCRVTEIQDEDERATSYRKLLANLKLVSSATLRRVLAHLHCLSQQSARNLMTVENISAVWGPTLMHAGENSAEDWNRSETKVVGDLIHLYPKLYQLSAADLAKEAKILEVLERHHVSNNRLRGAPSGDLKIWIYITNRDGECTNVTIGPQKTAFDVCRELADKAKYPAHELCLEESTLGGALERPLHHSERVLEVVARWGYWDTDDRKDNVLVLKKDRLYTDIVPLVKPPMTISGELKFADTKTKNLKNYLFEFSQAKLCCYRDKVCAMKLHEWRIEDIVWYLGHEPKRNPQMGWSITFIVKNNKPTRCKDIPFFGYTLAGASKDEQYRWLAAMLFGEYQLNLRPSAVNLMDP